MCATAWAVRELLKVHNKSFFYYYLVGFSWMLTECQIPVRYESQDRRFRLNAKMRQVLPRILKLQEWVVFLLLCFFWTFLPLKCSEAKLALNSIISTKAPENAQFKLFDFFLFHLKRRTAANLLIGRCSLLFTLPIIWALKFVYVLSLHEIEHLRKGHRNDGLRLCI